MSDQREPRFDVPRGRPRAPQGGPPPRPRSGGATPDQYARRRPPGPPGDGRAAPQRHRSAPSAPGSFRPRPEQLLTHDGGDGGVPTEEVIASRSGGRAQPTQVRQAGPRVSAGRRAPSRAAAAAGPLGAMGERLRSLDRRKVTKYGLIGLGAMVLMPFLAFLVGWLLFDVPTSQELKLTQVATFTFADGAPLATVRPENTNRTLVTLDRVPDHMQKAVLSAEDRSFYSNPGFDLVGIGRAVWNQLRGGVGGGSTVTQQYVKVSTGEDQSAGLGGLMRKYEEVVVAVKITREFTKDEILENYLNSIYMGRGSYGIQAASQAYFGKNVEDITVSEAGLLAAVIQAPSKWDPKIDEQHSRERWEFVMNGMVEQGWLDPAVRAQQQFPEGWDREPPSGGGVPDDDRHHIYQLALQELEAKGITQEQINTQGLTVTTTVQPEAQKDAVDAVQDTLKRQPDNLRSALVSVDPKNGAILAYYGGPNGLGTDYAQAMRQPGSSFKPFVLTAALEASESSSGQLAGFGLGTMLPGYAPMDFPGRPAVRNVEGVDCDLCGALDATRDSINTWYYTLGTMVGPDNVAKAAHQAGIPENMLPDPTGGIALGDKEVRPLDMASAYATFAAEGIHHAPHVVSKVEAADGEILYQSEAEAGEQVIDEQVARNVIEAMFGVVQKNNKGVSGHELAGKTGSVQLQGKDNKDAWMVGFTPSVSTAVWIGTDQSDPIREASGKAIFGSGVPSTIWQKFMTDALKGKDAEDFGTFVPIGTAPGTGEPAEGEDCENDEDGENNGDDGEDGENNEDGGDPACQEGNGGDGQNNNGEGDGDNNNGGDNGGNNGRNNNDDDGGNNNESGNNGGNDDGGSSPLGGTRSTSDESGRSGTRDG